MVARNTLGTSDGKEVFPQMNVKSATAIDLIKLPISLHACAPISELPYNISTMALPLVLVSIKEKHRQIYKLGQDLYVHGVLPNILISVLTIKAA